MASKLKRGTTDLCGILAVDKPAGITSHDVVGIVRRVTGERRVGHGGTLDPAATGLLVVGVGPATRLLRFFASGDKTYEALVAFGTETDTCDAEGTPVASSQVPPELLDAAYAAERVASLVGPVEQVPPSYSAVRIQGRKSYELARRGDPPELPARAVAVIEARLVRVHTGPPVEWSLVLTVSKGTFIRSIARDLGRMLGTHAHLSALRRTAAGTISVSQAVGVDELESAADAERFGELALDCAGSLGMPTAKIDAETARIVSAGAPLPNSVLSLLPDTREVALVHDGRLLAVYQAKDDAFAALVVIPGGCR